MLTADGRDLAQVHGIDDINDAIRNRRDWLSTVLFEEWQNGPVTMDYRRVADRYWNRLPLSLLKKKRFDFRSRPLAISPAAHFMMGGVRIDGHCATDLPGLFACGEVVWGLHGACRKGGNALAECLVFGRLAGLHAAGALGAGGMTRAALEETPSPEAPSDPADHDDPRELRRALQTLAWNTAGVVRTADGMQKGLEDLNSFFARIGRLPARPWQWGRVRADLMSMAVIIRAILSAGIARKESRGCFIRNDFPEEDNRHWLQNSFTSLTGGSGRPKVGHHPAEGRH